MYHAIVRIYKNYDYRSLYQTVVFPWRKTETEATEDRQTITRNIFYADWRIEHKENEDEQTTQP